MNKIMKKLLSVIVIWFWITLVYTFSVGGSLTSIFEPGAFIYAGCITIISMFIFWTLAMSLYCLLDHD